MILRAKFKSENLRIAFPGIVKTVYHQLHSYPKIKLYFYAFILELRYHFH